MSTKKTYKKLTDSEWAIIREAYEYRQPVPALKELAAEFGLGFSTVRNRSVIEEWKKQADAPGKGRPAASSLKPLAPTREQLDALAAQPDAPIEDINVALFFFVYTFIDACLKRVQKLRTDAGETNPPPEPAPARSFADAYGVTPDQHLQRGQAALDALAGIGKPAPAAPKSAADRVCANPNCRSDSVVAEIYRGIKQPDGVFKVPAHCVMCGKVQNVYFKIIKTELA